MNNEIKYNIDCLKSHKFNFDYLQKQLEAYENMRKEALMEITNNMQYDENIEDCWVTTYNLIDILNKVGGSDE